jgi:NitT/TauT family transport system permease protein
MMSKPAVIRLLIVVVVVLAIEVACRTGMVARFTLVPPSEMVVGLLDLLASGRLNRDLYSTLRAVAIALAASVLVGFAVAVILDRLPRLRRSLEPLFATYYSIPVYVFYPLFIVLFGLTDTPKITIGFMFAVVAVIMTTLNGLDRVPSVLRKTARTYHMGTLATAYHLVLPYAAPYLLSGIKLAVAYSLIGVIGSEFILASAGIGYRVAFAYNNFDTLTMYSLILFVLIVSTVVNMLLFRWEKTLLRRRGFR